MKIKLVASSKKVNIFYDWAIEWWFRIISLILCLLLSCSKTALPSISSKTRRLAFDERSKIWLTDSSSMFRWNRFADDFNSRSKTDNDSKVFLSFLKKVFTWWGRYELPFYWAQAELKLLSSSPIWAKNESFNTLGGQSAVAEWPQTL